MIQIHPVFLLRAFFIKKTPAMLKDNPMSNNKYFIDCGIFHSSIVSGFLFSATFRSLFPTCRETRLYRHTYLATCLPEQSEFSFSLFLLSHTLVTSYSQIILSKLVFFASFDNMPYYIFLILPEPVTFESILGSPR